MYAHNTSTTGFSNDPRLAARMQLQQQQAPAVVDEETRKRHASRSPSASDRPAQKHAKLGTNSSGRQQSISGVDPHKPSSNVPSLTGSRRLSMQTSGGNLTSQPPTSPVIQAVANKSDCGAHVSTSLSSRQNEVLSAFMASNNYAAELAGTRMFHAQAQAQKDKADRELKKFAEHHANFPAMKEQHMRAKQLADEAFKTWNDKLRRQERSQQTIMNNLVKLLVPSTEDAASNADYITRAEYNNLASDHRTLNEKLITLENRVDALPPTTPAMESDANLVPRLDALENTVKVLEDKLSQQPDSGLMARIDALQDTMNIVQASQSQKPDTGLAGRVNALEGAIRVVEHSINQQRDSLVRRIDTLNGTVEEIEKSLDQQFGIIDTYVNEELKKNHKSLSDEIDQAHKSLDSLIGQLGERFSTDLESQVNHLRESFNDGNKTQHQNAEAINKCVNRLDNIEAQSYATTDELKVIEKNVSDFSASTKLPGINADGLLKFRPILPDNEEEENLPRLQRLETDVATLHTISQHHKQILDNTTSEQLFMQMINMMHAQYPYPRDFQGTVEWINNTINHNVTNINGKISDMSARFQNLESSTIGQEVGSLRTDIAAVNLQVAKHEDIVAGGQKAIEQINGDIKTIKRDVVLLRTAIDKIVESVPEKMNV